MNKYRLSSQVIFIMLIFFALSCSRKEKEEITTDLVNIPVSAEDEKGKEAGPVIQFETTDHDFGTLKQGEKVSFTYKFKNVGNANLIISTVVPGCGCTVAQFTKTPVKPGESGFVSISLNTEDKKGLVRKKVAVQANTYPAETQLWFMANVELP